VPSDAARTENPAPSSVLRYGNRSACYNSYDHHFCSGLRLGLFSGLYTKSDLVQTPNLMRSLGVESADLSDGPVQVKGFALGL